VQYKISGDFNINVHNHGWGFFSIKRSIFEDFLI